MEINLKASTDMREDAEIIFLNENLGNENFVEIMLPQGEEAVTVSVEELYQAALVFENIRKSHL